MLLKLFNVTIIVLLFNINDDTVIISKHAIKMNKAPESFNKVFIPPNYITRIPLEAPNKATNNNNELDAYSWAVNITETTRCYKYFAIGHGLRIYIEM